MITRSLPLSMALLVFCAFAAMAQNRNDVIATPVLRAEVSVAGDVVRIGDLIDNAGAASQIAVYRAPDLGTTGTLSVAQVIAALRNHQVIGVDTKDIREISITRLARTIEIKDVEQQVAAVLEKRNGLGVASNLSLTFDRDIEPIQLDPSNSGIMKLVLSRFEPRSGRFDLTFEVANEARPVPMRLRYTGSVVETAEAAVLTRGVERNEVLRPTDVVIERRPKADVGADPAGRDNTVGMQAKRQLRAGQVLRAADLGKPDLVQRDQNVTLVYDGGGIYLTVRGKAMEAGAEGDTVNVLNMTSKRAIAGVVVGRGQVAVAAILPRAAAPAAEAPAAIDPTETTGSVPAAAGDAPPVSQKAE